MAMTQEQIDAYERMIDAAGSIQSLTVGGQTFVFRPLPEMRARLAEMRRELAQAQGSQTRFATHDKGF